MVTLKDIAKRAGVSVMTVSNVINGNHHKVSQKTIEEVLAIANELNYQPNLSARTLAGKRSNIISLIIPASEGSNFIQNPYNSIMVGEIEAAISRRGYFLMLHSVERYLEMMAAANQWNADGIILHGVFDDDIAELEKVRRRSSIPMVVLDSYLSTTKDIINVGIEDFRGGYLSARYLLSKGHRNIAFISYPFDRNIPGVLNNRYEGLLTALQEAGITEPPTLISTSESNYQGGVIAGQQLGTMAPNKRPSAVVVPADVVAIGVMEGARLSGLAVPEQLSIIGFDDLEVCLYSSPKLTTIHQDIPGKAQKAVELLLQEIETGKPVKPIPLIDIHLVERESVVTWKEPPSP